MNAEVAGSGDHFTHELIVRFVFVETVTDPAVKGVGAAGVAVLIPFVAKNRAPFVCEIICVVRVREQSVNEFGTLVIVGVIGEIFHLFHVRNAAGKIDGHASDKRCVVAFARRWQSE